MDQEKLGLFNLLLKNHYEENIKNIEVDFVETKREKMMGRLHLLHDAFKQKDYDKANFVLLNICDKILNDPYADEYNMKLVQTDMTVFSSAIASITVRNYKRVQQITRGLIMKYRNPIFYHVLGISYFYDLSFSEAQNQFSEVMQLLSENRNTKFPWPDTDIMIITVSAEKIREYALSFLEVIKSIQDVKCVLHKSDFKNMRELGDGVGEIEILKVPRGSSLNLNMDIGHFVQYEIYPHIRAMLGEFVKFDKSKLPIQYREVINGTSHHNLQKGRLKENKDNSTNTPAKVEKSANKAIVINGTSHNNLQKGRSKENRDSSTNTPAKVEKTADKVRVINGTFHGNERSKENKDSGTNNPAIVEKNADKKAEASEAKVKEAVAAETKEPPSKENAPNNPTKVVTKKNQILQTQIITKSKQTQTGSKVVNQSTQTSEDITGLSNKCKSTPDQEILNLKMKLVQLNLKLKSAESKHNHTKNDIDVSEKIKFIGEQQRIITDLKQKLTTTNAKQNYLETKLNKANTKLSEISKANKSMVIEVEQNRESIKKYQETIAELRNHNQMLQKNSKCVIKKQEEAKVTQKNLFDKYRSSYFAHIQFYENFHKRCDAVLTVLDKIRGHLTEITVPTLAECEEMISQWFSAMISCQEVLQKYQKIYNKCDKYISEDSLKELLILAPLVPFKEPPDLLLESIPILIYTIVDFEKMLQNNGRAKNKNKETVDVGIEARNGTEGKTDYRKKSNFIHKNETTFSSDDNASSVLKPLIKEESTGEIENSLPNNKKIRSLLAYLRQHIPLHTENEIIKALNSCRQKNQGSLSGLTLQYILYNVMEILETAETAWSSIKDGFWQPEQEKEVCPICIEPIENEKYVLSCNHTYHTACIQEWFTINRVCAVCRKYTVLDEDFPPLKNSD